MLMYNLKDSYYNTADSRAYIVPIRWQAIECLQTEDFTLKSDVWSYGVVLWEVYTYGASPYAGGKVESQIFIKFQVC